MEQLPEVLCFVISKAATSGKKLSWSVWNIGDTTTVKLCWKPEPLSLSRPMPPSPQGLRLPSATNSNVKKKRSPSSKKRSIQRLRNFLAKKKGQGVKPSAIQESSGTPNSAHPPSSSNEKALAEETKAAELDADNTETVPSVEFKKKGRGVKASGVQESPASDTADSIIGDTPPSTPVCKPRQSSSSLTDLLREAKNVVYEARDDSTGISFVTNGKREWVPIVVTKGDREMSAAELKGCKRIVYFEEGERYQKSLDITILLSLVFA